MNSPDGQVAFLNALIPTKLPDTVRQTSLGYLHQLCLPLLQEHQRAGDMLNLPAEYLSYSSQHFPAASTDRAAAHKTLVTSKLLTLSPLASALNTPWGSLPNAEKYEQWLGLVILCCCSLHIKGDHNSAIESALREIRLIATNANHQPLLELLPSPQDFDYLLQLDEHLHELRKSYLNLPSVQQQGLGYLTVVIRSVARNRKGVTRQRGESSSPTSVPPTPQTAATFFVPLIDTGVDDPEFRIEKLTSFSKASENEDKPTTIVTSVPYRFHDRSLHKKEIALQAIHSIRLAEQMRVRQQSLPCSFEQASEWDIEHLVTHALSALTRNDHTAGWVLLSLLSGRDPGWHLPNAHKVRITIINQAPCRTLTHRVPAGRQPNHLDALLPAVLNTLHLPLPQQMTAWVESAPLQAPLPTAQVLRTWLKAINQAHSTRLTMGRINRYMEHWLLNQGTDRAVIALIRGDAHQGRPSLSYSHQERIDVLAHHYRFINAVFDLSGQQASLPPIKAKSGALGSRLHLPGRVLHNLFSVLAQAFNLEKDFINFHNKYVVYVWALLSFVTGHRDVNAPMGLLSDLNPHQQTWWISDKERRHGLAARTLVVPATAIEQVNLYKEHLSDIASYARLSIATVCARCERTLSGDENSLFFLEENDGAVVPVEITPSRLALILGEQLPWARNWGRHHMRSELLRYQVSPEVIDGWMGHEELGEEAMGPFSQLGMSQLRRVADVIQAILTHHEIKALPGWKTR
ncbi:hypothetical protein SAMN05216198_0733 [Halopseudomonas litoralis]|uniref:Uncharacterized protein n=1 Tax=Halopseudomonas litoralis TaxID=797277 RepID=A0A1H1MV21_9GAMM|nr:hypothetical protein [Halopseudomonas litoralis]SDR90462.1 hypothetical protein SAMN05216198_0733 [Halopseudomonas litoralis]